VTGPPMMLEMRERPRLAPPRPHRPGMLLRVETPTPRFYEYLTTTLIGAWPPSPERALSPEELVDLFAGDAVEVYALYMAGEPIGCFEIERTAPDRIDLVHFGLADEHRDGVLAKHLLAAAVDAAWAAEPDVVGVRLGASATPRDVLLYQWAGFEVVPMEEAAG